MGLNGACFNPHHSLETSFVSKDVFPVPSDKGLVDYLVHGKRTMIQTYDPTIGDLPYVEKEKKEPVKVILNPKWYDAKKWNKMQAPRVPATCSIPHTPEYEIIHTAPYSKCYGGPSMPTPTGIEFPDSMVDAVPLSYEIVTSKVISGVEEFRGEAYVKAQSPYFGMMPRDIINAKLDLVVKMVGKKSTGRKHIMGKVEWNPIYGGWNCHAGREEMTYEKFIKHYHADYTDPCQPHGHLSDEDYQTLEFDYSEDGVEYDDVHYRAGHWISGDIVETQEPLITKMYAPTKVDKKTFYQRTRVETRRAGYFTLPQWEALFGMDDVPEAVKTATPGVHPLAPLLGMKRVSARFIDGLRASGYTVEKRRVGDSHREVACLIV